MPPENTHLRRKPEVTLKRGLRTLELTEVNNMADVLAETVGENHATATGKTSHKCCAAAQCTNRTDNRKDQSRSMHFRKMLVVGWSGQ